MGVGVCACVRAMHAYVSVCYQENMCNYNNAEQLDICNLLTCFSSCVHNIPTYLTSDIYKNCNRVSHNKYDLS